MILGYMAIDQFGTKYDIKKHPRKELLEYLGASKADKVYTDTKSGDVKHTGYYIKGLWLTVYAIHDWGKYAKFSN